jgi:predicted transcriptional regulator
MSLKIEITDKPPQNLEEILKSLFWKEPELVKTAEDFLQYIKEWDRTETPYTVDQWKQYTLKNDITQSTYHNMLKRLRRAGMIEKKYNQGRKKHELHLKKEFSEFLYQMYSIWDSYLKS